MAIKHAKTSAKNDGADSSLVQPSDWNASHAIEAGTIVNADVAAAAEIAVSKLADGTPYQTLRTDSAGTGVEWGYKLYVGTSAPSSPSTNDIWIDTTA